MKKSTNQAQVSVNPHHRVTNKLLKIKDIYIDKDLYPRGHINQFVSAKYYNALRANANFQPIVVGDRKNKQGKYVMIDGAHRTKAMKDVGEQYIQAEIWEGLSDQEIFEKSVQLNATHGKPFETYEVVNIINKFKETFNYSWEQISDIVRIPVSDIQKFVATRMTRIIETQEPFALKKELYDYAGVGISETSSLPSEQKNFEGSTQIKMVDSLIVILKNDWVTKSEQLDHRFKKLRNLLNERYPED